MTTENVEMIFRFKDGTEYKLSMPFKQREIAGLRTAVEGYVKLVSNVPMLLSALAQTVRGLVGLARR